MLKHPELPARDDAFEQRLAKSWPIAQWGEVTVLLAVSGGPDSIALARAMAALCGLGKQGSSPGQGRIVVAHFNHGLRPGAADADEAFVVGFCREHGLACHVGRPETRDVERPTSGSHTDDAPRGSQGFEAAARRARYDFLCRTAGELGARYVATAHTADDQAETILHNIVRGTGLAGLRGIPRTRCLGSGVVVVRPMLDIRRSEVLAYLAQLRQPYRTDASNLDTARSRNRIRHDLLPRLEADYNPRVVDRLVRLGQLAGEAQQIVEHQADQLTDRCATFVGPESGTVRRGSDTATVRRGSTDPAVATVRRGSPDPDTVRRGSPDPAVRVDCRPLSEVPEHLVCEMLKCVWRRLAWPQMDMGYDEWRSLAKLARERATSNGAAGATSRDLPGGIRAKRTATEMVLSRRAT